MSVRVPFVRLMTLAWMQSVGCPLVYGLGRCSPVRCQSSPITNPGKSINWLLPYPFARQAVRWGPFISWNEKIIRVQTCSVEHEGVPFWAHVLQWIQKLCGVTFLQISYGPLVRSTRGLQYFQHIKFWNHFICTSLLTFQLSLQSFIWIWKAVTELSAWK